MITMLIARFGTYIGIGAAVLVAFLAWDSSRVNHGRKLEQAAVEKQNAVVKEKGSSAARKSRVSKPGDGGVQLLPEVSD